MLKRTIALSLLLLLSVGIMLPFVSSNAHGVRQSSQVGQRRNHRYRSRAWWRRYRARLRKKRAAAAAEMAHRNALLTIPANLNFGNFTVVTPAEAASATTGASRPRFATTAKPVRTTAMPVTTTAMPVATDSKPVTTTAKPVATETKPVATEAKPVVTTAKPPAVTAKQVVATPKPLAVTARQVVATPKPKANAVATVVTPMSSGPVLVNAPVVVNTPAPVTPKATAEAHPVTEALLRPKNPVTPLPGQLSISVVALSRPNPAFLTPREESRLLAGVAVADLRRIVIDKMVVAGGWVINDYVREINGGRVFVVTAKTPRDGQTAEKAWTFYFTESGGRIYSLTTDSPVEHSNRMSKEAERFIGTLRSTVEEK